MSRRTKHSRVPMFDRMEDRKLLSFTTSLVAGVLTIRGNAANDNVVVVERDGHVELTGRSHRGAKTSFVTADVERLVFIGNAGDDRFSNDTSIPVTASGGRGNDILTGGSGADILNGNEGKDLIHGGAGNDSVLGGGGNDSLSGDDGKDSLSGDSGDDKIHGDAGDDSVLGGSGNDSLFGEDGNDQLDDHQGRNTFDGGSGGDHVDGGVDDHGGDAGDVNDDHGSGDHVGSRSVVASYISPDVLNSNGKKKESSRRAKA